jgi:glycosyltransferase involved in cell wall biosynthesis/ubiquinone/menaquinone biosynthesis C-methylase UbiE
MMKDSSYYDKIYNGRYHVDENRVRYTASLCSGKVLDVGCGDGRLAQFCDGHYLGLDFSQAAIDLAAHRNPGKKFKVHDFIKEPMPRGSWHTIVLGELLEHLDNKTEALLLKKIRQSLAPNGHLVVTVPNGAAVPDPAHVREFTDGVLPKALGAIGPILTHPYSDQYLVATAHRKQPKLSIVLIVKNEEELLPTCLDSLKGLWDELVIVDTGSSDKTIEIAKSYGARMGHFPWCDDFAAARNYAEGLCFGEYLYWQDADEILLEGHEAIRQIVSEGKQDGIAPFMIFSRDKNGNPATTYARQELLHKNTKEWSWHGAAHNWLNGTGRIEHKDIVVEHLSRPSGDRPNHADMFDALRSDLEKETLTERTLFYLARQHFYKKHWHECLGLVALLLQIPPGWPIQRSRACLMAADCWRALGDEKSAWQAALKSLAEFAGWAEPYFWLGKTARAQKRYEEAIGWLLASTAFSPSTYFVDQTIYDWYRWDELALACHKAGRNKEALKYGGIALAARPDSERLKVNMEYYEKALKG